jgi:hypothetical protein
MSWYVVVLAYFEGHIASRLYCGGVKEHQNKSARSTHGIAVSAKALFLAIIHNRYACEMSAVCWRKWQYKLPISHEVEHHDVAVSN